MLIHCCIPFLSSVQHQRQAVFGAGLSLTRLLLAVHPCHGWWIIHQQLLLTASIHCAATVLQTNCTAARALHKTAGKHLPIFTSSTLHLNCTHLMTTFVIRSDTADVVGRLWITTPYHRSVYPPQLFHLLLHSINTEPLKGKIKTNCSIT